MEHSTFIIQDYQNLNHINKEVMTFERIFKTKEEWFDFRSSLVMSKGYIYIEGVGEFTARVSSQYIYDDIMNKCPMGWWWPWKIRVIASPIKHAL